MAKINEALRREFCPLASLSGWASLVAQMVKNLSAVQEIWIQSLGQEESLQKGMATFPVFLPENSMDRGAWWATLHGVTELDRLSD